MDQVESEDIYVVKNVSLSRNSPDSLFDICIAAIIGNISIICSENHITGALHLKDNVILHRELCEKLIEEYQKKHIISDTFINIFKDRNRTTLKKVELVNSEVTDEGLKILLAHGLKYLSLTKCDKLTINSYDDIYKYSGDLLSFSLGNKIVYFTEFYSTKEYTLNAPNLRELNLRQQNIILYPNILLQNLHHLTHLDLSECIFICELPNVNKLENLESLILFNIPRLWDIIDWICKHDKLVHLDISYSNVKNGTFPTPNQQLCRIIRSLPKLMSLDISGTNLAGNGVSAMGCDIPGLAQRSDRPLAFLGLYKTSHAACCRYDIPALKISGHANEDQILTAAIAYLDRPEVLAGVLNDLYHLFRCEKNNHVGEALIIVLEAIERHTKEKDIQITGSASLFYIVKGKERHCLGVKLKQRIITSLITGMEAHMNEITMMRNGCLTLCQFNLPFDVVFEYRRVATVLLHGVSETNIEGFVQRIAIFLLNSLACHIDGSKKQFLGDSGTISKMLALISDRLNRNICDDVLEMAWSTMWNVTDETPDNCRRFLDDMGMEYFLGCLKSFPDKEELLRNMMGLLGNVAEVAELRPVYMASHFLTVFNDLLDYKGDSIEIRYNAAGILAHLASDGPAAWTVDDPPRAVVLGHMSEAVERWDLNTKRNINYRSFQPIFGLVTAYHTPECQHWALWALANLTTLYPEKYCSLVEAENGGILLKEIIDHSASTKRMKYLANKVLHNCYY